jgi:hypothetical protein
MNKKVIGIIITLSIVAIVVIVILVLPKHKNDTNNNGGNGGKFSWKAGDTGTCSVPCGGGTQYIQYLCEDSNGNIAPDSQCTGMNPSGLFPCNTTACAWTPSNWSTCIGPNGATCGPGTQTRTLSCQNGLVPNSVCLSPAPPTSQSCSNPDCTWTTGPWGACSETCGYDGTQTRTVTCPVSGACSGTAPVSSQNCPNTYCSWTTSGWTPAGDPPNCNNSVCGTLAQTQTVTCPRSDNNCNPALKPQTSQTCNTGKICTVTQKNYPYNLPSLQKITNLLSQNIPQTLFISTNQYMGLSLDTSSSNVVVSTILPVMNTISCYNNQVLGPYTFISFIYNDLQNNQWKFYINTNFILKIYMPSLNIQPPDYFGEFAIYYDTTIQDYSNCVAVSGSFLPLILKSYDSNSIIFTFLPSPIPKQAGSQAGIIPSSLK